MNPCLNCGQAIEPVDGPGVKYSHRHVESKRRSHLARRLKGIPA